ncbi:MAG: hypothetical protein GTN36_00640 [Candidatus Aenigmarchaeota archaeon]|nr:hypothetical protein [Candidatus Aenigmarchaeota archaeon]
MFESGMAKKFYESGLNIDYTDSRIFWDEQSKKDAREMNRQNFLDFAFEHGKVVIIDMNDDIMDKTEEKWFE